MATSDAVDHHARRAHQLAVDAREAARARLRDQLVAAAACVVAAVCGLAVLGYAVHTTDAQVGRIAFWGGLALGNGGIFAALLWLYVRAEGRGDRG